MKKLKIPISFKLIGTLSVTVIVSLLAMNWWANETFKSDMIIQIQENIAERPNMMAQNIESNIGPIIEETKLIASNLWNEFQTNQASGESISAEQLNQQEVAISEDILYIALYSKSDRPEIVKDILNPKNIRKIKDIKIFEDITPDKASFLKKVIDKPYFYNATYLAGFKLLALVFPVKPKYFAVAYLNHDILDRILTLVKDSRYEVYIVNHYGDLIAYKEQGKDKELEILKEVEKFRGDYIVQKMQEDPIGERQISYLNSNGIEYMGAYSKIDAWELGIINTIPRERAFSVVKRIQVRNYFIAIIITSISIMITYLLAKSLSKPISLLMAATLKVEEGYFLFNIPTPAYIEDELVDLTNTFTHMGTGLAERERVKDALGRFVNEEIAELALKGELSLGGERKNAAVFFSDIRSFTAISEKLSPEEIVEFLNEYMTAMVACVNATSGTVDKFIGDAVMALWGVPVSHGNDTENAINGALMMRIALQKFNEGRGTEKKPIIKIGCGINTGPLISGQIGSVDRMEYTVIGDTVNLASRIEGLSKPFGMDILISESSYNEIDKNKYYIAEMPKIMVKGKAAPVKIYAILGRKDDSKAFKNVAELRKYLGTENTDLSQFDGSAGAEEKFKAVSAEQK